MFLNGFQMSFFIDSEDFLCFHIMSISFNFWICLISTVKKGEVFDALDKTIRIFTTRPYFGATMTRVQSNVQEKLKRLLKPPIESPESPRKAPSHCFSLRRLVTKFLLPAQWTVLLRAVGAFSKQFWLALLGSQKVDLAWQRTKRNHQETTGCYSFLLINGFLRR